MRARKLHDEGVNGMKNKLIVVADLGLLKAYRLEKTRLNTPHLTLIEERQPKDAHAKLVQKVSDQAGRYRVPTSNMAMSFGERDKIDLEMRKRLVKELADSVQKLLHAHGVEQCYFAASKEINHPLLEALDSSVRSKIVRNVSADLTKTDKAELLQFFTA